MTDTSGWLTAGVAISALIINMLGTAIRFEVRMTRLERDIEWIKKSMPVPRRRTGDP